MQTNIKSYKEFTTKLPELQKRWHEFSASYIQKNEDILIFNKRNFQIKSTRYWFYLLHRTGAACWNLFTEHCIKEYGSFEVDFSGFIFDEPINFEGFNFESVNFFNSFFKVPANFQGARFQKYVNFSTCTFLHEINFQGAYFEHAIFAHCQFKNTANFSQSQHKEVYFNQAEFQKTVNFSGGIFEKVNFLKTFFYSSVDFSRATFTQEFNLNDIDLQQAESIFFEKAKFLKQINFQNCNFPIVSFSEAEFQQAADFSHASFKKKVNFSEAKFLQEAKFLKSIFFQEVNFSDTVFEKLTNFESSVFHQNANFHKLRSDGELYFNGVLFKEEAIFRNYHPKSFTSFKNVCFEQLVEFGTDANYNKQLIDFTGVKIYFNHKNKWTTDYNTLIKIQQLRHLVWRLKDKKLNRNLSQLERLARRGIKIKQLLSQIKNFWQTDKKERGFWGYFLKFIFFIFFAIPWSIRFLLFWPLGQISIFFYGTKSHNNYIRSLFFLALSYPIFYFLYTQTALLQDGIVLGNCSRIQAYSFTLQHYLPFVDNWTFINNWNGITPYLQKCFASIIPPKTYNIVIAQSIFSILLIFFTLLPLLENIFNWIKFTTKKRNTDTVALISGGLNPTEKTATISLPDSDTIPIILGEQPSSEIRKIRDEDIIDNPDIAQPSSKPHIPHHYPTAQPSSKPHIPHHYPTAQPIEKTIVHHKPYNFVPNPDFLSNKEPLHFERGFKKRFSFQWPHPLLKKIIDKNKIQASEVVAQMNKAQETSQTEERRAFGGVEPHSGEAEPHSGEAESHSEEVEFYREKAEQQQQIQTPPANTDALKEDPVVLHRTILEREKEKYKYSKDKIDRIRQIRSMSSNMFKR